MPKSTLAGYGFRAPANVMDGDEPCSSWRAIEAYQNLRHFTDEYCQTRINWLVKDLELSGAEGLHTDEDPPYIWSAEYPHTWLGEGRPANVDVFVQGTGAMVWCRLIPARFSLGDLSAPYVFSQVLDLTGTGYQSATITHVNTPDMARVFDLAWEQPGTIDDEDGNAYSPRLCMMRLEVCVLSSSDAQWAVHGIQLREFA